MCIYNDRVDRAFTDVLVKGLLAFGLICLAFQRCVSSFLCPLSSAIDSLRHHGLVIFLAFCLDLFSPLLHGNMVTTRRSATRQTRSRSQGAVRGRAKTPIKKPLPAKKKKLTKEKKASPLGQRTIADDSNSVDPQIGSTVRLETHREYKVVDGKIVLRHTEDPWMFTDEVIPCVSAGCCHFGKLFCVCGSIIRCSTFLGALIHRVRIRQTPEACCSHVNRVCCVDFRASFPPNKKIVPFEVGVCGLTCGERGRYSKLSHTTELWGKTACGCCSLGFYLGKDCCSTHGHNSILCIENDGKCDMLRDPISVADCHCQSGCCDMKCAAPPTDKVPFQVGLGESMYYTAPPLSLTMSRGLTVGTLVAGGMLLGDYVQRDTALLKAIDTVDSVFGKDVFDVFMGLPGQYSPLPR